MEVLTKTRDVLPSFLTTISQGLGWAGGGLKMSSRSAAAPRHLEGSGGNACSSASFPRLPQRSSPAPSGKEGKGSSQGWNPIRNDTTTENVGNVSLFLSLLSLSNQTNVVNVILSLQVVGGALLNRELIEEEERGKRRKWVEGEPPLRLSPIGRASNEFLPPSEQTVRWKQNVFDLVSN